METDKNEEIEGGGEEEAKTGRKRGETELEYGEDILKQPTKAVCRRILFLNHPKNT